MPVSKTICVFCASSDQVDPAYFAVARQMGHRIGCSGHRLVWGGGRVGLMGELARATRAAGGHLIGVIPESLRKVEVAYMEADELIVTADMRQRKHVMDQRADAFVVLPGGFGTLEELSEILVQKILGYTDRPLVILNSMGFYDKLLELFEHFIAQGFARQKHRTFYHVVSQVEEALAVIEASATN